MAVQRDEVIRARRERRALDAAVVRGQREDDDLDFVAVVHPDHAGDELAVRVRAEPDAARQSLVRHLGCRMKGGVLPSW